MAYGQATVSVTSATTPVSLIAPTDKASWLVKPRAAAAVPILVFFYSGTLPSSAPANVMEVSPGTGFSDSDYSMSYHTDSMQQGIAAVLESGTTAVTVDAVWKP